LACFGFRFQGILEYLANEITKFNPCLPFGVGRQGAPKSVKSCLPFGLGRQVRFLSTQSICAVFVTKKYFQSIFDCFGL